MARMSQNRLILPRPDKPGGTVRIVAVTQRSTAENVIVLLSVAVFLVIIIVTVGLVLDEILFPSGDPSNTRLINWITSMVDTIIGALIGFVAGAAVVSRANGNGKPK